MKKAMKESRQTVERACGPMVAVSGTTASSGWEHQRHQHRKAQLVYSARGVLSCEVESGIWIVPPQCAIWIPAGLPHSARSGAGTECLCLYIEPEATHALPDTCCTVSISPLLHQLVLRAVTLLNNHAAENRAERLVAVLLDELSVAQVQDLHFPMPRDPRLRRLAVMLLRDPADKTSTSGWADRIGISERTMSRIISNEIGMSFGRWRRQLHVILALQRLIEGQNVQTVALDLGYDNASGFVNMFRKMVGMPPARYVTERRVNAAGLEPLPL